MQKCLFVNKPCTAFIHLRENYNFYLGIPVLDSHKAHKVALFGAKLSFGYDHSAVMDTISVTEALLLLCCTVYYLRCCSALPCFEYREELIYRVA